MAIFAHFVLKICTNRFRDYTYFAFYSLIPLMRIIVKLGSRCDCRRTYYKTTLLLSFGFFHFVFLQSADTQSLIYTKEVINVNVLFRIIFDFTDSMINLIKFYFFFFNIFILFDNFTMHHDFAPENLYI